MNVLHRQMFARNMFLASLAILGALSPLLAQLPDIEQTTTFEMPNTTEITRPITSPSRTMTTVPSTGQQELINTHERRNSTDGKPVVTVAIIGSGMSGISAARILADETDFDVIVLEANVERYGGRIWSYEVPGNLGKPIELGAMWIHGGLDSSHPLNQLATKYGIATVENDVGDSDQIEIYDMFGRKYSAEDMKNISKVPQLIQNLRQEYIDKNLSDINYERAIEILKQRNPKLMEQNPVRFFEIPGMESYQGSTMDQISLIYSDGIPGGQSDVEYHGNDVIVANGYRRILDSLITSGRNFQIELARQVLNVDHSALDSEGVILTTIDNRSNERHIYYVDHVVVAVPLGILKAAKIQFNPTLPHAKTKAIANIGFGNMVKVLLVFDEVFWPDVNFLGVESVDPTGLPLFFVNLNKIHQLPALVASICSKGAVAADKMSESELIKKVLEHLELILGANKLQNRRLVHTKITRWRNDPLIGGAYSFGKIGMTSEDAYNIRTPMKPFLFFAGEHTMFPEAMHGTVHAAHLSGVRAAREVMEQRGYPLKSAGASVNWLGKVKTAAILSHLILSFVLSW